MREPLLRRKWSRAEKVAYAQQRRAEGALLREIAAEMDCAIQTVHTWLSDPDLSRQNARREGYKGTCVDCGASTSGCNGRDAAPERCTDCTNARANKLGRDHIIRSINEWADENGGIPPAATDWNAAWAEQHGRPDKARKYREAQGRWPASTTVIYHFGTWNAAIEAAGFEPRRPSSYGRIGDDPGVRAQAVQLYLGGLNSREVADELGCSHSSVCGWVRAAGHEIRGRWEMRDAA